MALVWSDSTTNAAMRRAQPSPSPVLDSDICAGLPPGHVTRLFSTLKKLNQDIAYVVESLQQKE
jgi:hypothetical protein